MTEQTALCVVYHIQTGTPWKHFTIKFKLLFKLFSPFWVRVCISMANLDISQKFLQSGKISRKNLTEGLTSIKHWFLSYVPGGQVMITPDSRFATKLGISGTLDKLATF